jgi:hypothetical protein
LGHKTIPQVEREVFVDAAKASNEVILEGGRMAHSAALQWWIPGGASWK